MKLLAEVMGSVAMAALGLWFTKAIGLYQAANEGAPRMAVALVFMLLFVMSFRAGFRGLPNRLEGKGLDHEDEPSTKDDRVEVSFNCPKCSGALKFTK